MCPSNLWTNLVATGRAATILFLWKRALLRALQTLTIHYQEAQNEDLPTDILLLSYSIWCGRTVVAICEMKISTSIYFSLYTDSLTPWQFNSATFHLLTPKERHRMFYTNTSAQYVDSSELVAVWNSSKFIQKLLISTGKARGKGFRIWGLITIIPPYRGTYHQILWENHPPPWLDLRAVFSQLSRSVVAICMAASMPLSGR